MNKKALNILLIPGALIIWALILLKIYSFSKKPEIETYSSPIHLDPQDTVLHIDTLKIYANYRDPFLPSSIKMSSITKSNESLIKPVQNKVNAILPWPKISYRGLIKSIKDGKERILLTISDRCIIVEMNSDIEGIKIIANYPDSLKIQYKKETKTISKN